MLSKFKQLAKFGKKTTEIVDLDKIKNELYDGLFLVVNDVFDKRKLSLDNDTDTLSVEEIVKKYTRKNMILATASSIVPGPFGVLGAVPELILNFKNQMEMIYDLGYANKKQDFINKDILLDIPIAAFGGNTNLSTLQNSTTNLIDSPEEVLIQKAAALGQSVVERTLKKSVVQFIPVAGPVLMGTWAKLTTKKISKNSIAFLKKSEVYTEHLKPDEDEETKRQLQKEKIKALANLIESNNEINENQIELIATIIENANLNDEEKKYFLEESLRTDSKFQLDTKLIKTFEEDDDLIMQLVIMAKRSGHIDEFEKAYIYQVGKALDFQPSFIDELF